ncbi:MFS transporter [Fangia hongkongensis]|uniref:MFS transporter n=1 Tax=Fangia hongkongensis TaxID=270495 RepID=UPI0003748496|nr:MFS transporter [Fangia hongkongensis]
MRFLYAAEMVLNIVKAIVLIAAAVSLMASSDNVVLFGFAILFEVISSVIAPLSIGKLIDKKGALIIYKIMMLVLCLCIALCYFLFSLVSTELYIFIAYSLISFFSPLLRLAQQSYFLDIRETVNLKKINSCYQMAVQFGQISGLIVAAMLVDRLDFHQIHLLLLFVLLCSVVCAFCVKSKIQNLPSKVAHISTVKLVKSIPLIAVLIIIVSAFDYVILSIFNLSLPVLTSIYKDQGFAMSLFDMSYAVGAIVISYLLAKGFGSDHGLKLSRVAYIVLPFAIIALVLTSKIEYRVLIILAIGAMLSLSTIGFNSYIQSILPKNVIGRVLALRRICLAIMLFIFVNTLSFTQSFNTDAFYYLLIIIVLMLSFMIVYVTYKEGEGKNVEIHTLSKREV